MRWGTCNRRWPAALAAFFALRRHRNGMPPPRYRREGLFWGGKNAASARGGASHLGSKLMQTSGHLISEPLSFSNITASTIKLPTRCPARTRLLSRRENFRSLATTLGLHQGGLGGGQGALAPSSTCARPTRAGTVCPQRPADHPRDRALRSATRSPSPRFGAKSCCNDVNS